MKSTFRDPQTVEALVQPQRGVFSTADLRTALPDPHPVSFARRIRALIAAGVITRFLRGWYVAEGFDPATLSQRLAPDSYVSFGNVLSANLVIGTVPARRLMAVKLGPARTYRGPGIEIVHVGISEDLFFGWEVRNGVRYADSEKAALDTLYFHLRGRKYVFDPLTDMDVGALDRGRLNDYLSRYKNSKFVAFARSVLEMEP